MATTYGYGGEFSSDEDVDRIEQQQNERMVQAKFDNNNRPGKRQIEELISLIKNAPYDQEFELTDEFLAGLLDYYKTPRGPIVDSTRKLYHKIALRLIRGDQPQSTDDTASNGNVVSTNNNNNNNNNFNNNSINLISSKAPQQSAEAFSSDDDDEPVVLLAKKSPESRISHDDNDENKMEVDSETPSGKLRETKQMDMSTTDEESEESSEDSGDLDVLNGESDVLDATPIKPSVAESRMKDGVEALMAARPSTPKQAESTAKRLPVAHSTPKADTGKKPYIRSQRVATRSATRNSGKAREISKKSPATTNAEPFIETKQAPTRRYIFFAIPLLVIALALLFYHFKPNMVKSAKPIISF